MAGLSEKERSFDNKDGAAVVAEKPSGRFKVMPRRLKGIKLPRSFWMFLLTSCLFNTGMFVYVLLYNLYLRDIGYQVDFITLMTGFSQAGTIVGTFGAVALTRRVGMQRAVSVCLAGTAIMAVLRVMVVGQVTLLAATFVAGMFFALWAISITVIIAQTTSEQMRPVAFSVFFATVIGIGIGADAIGGYLPSWIEQLFGVSSAARSKQWALLAACTFIFLSVLPTLYLKLAHAPARARVRYPRNSFVLRFMIAVAVLNVATAAFNPIANLYFSEYLRMPAHSIGLAFSGGQLAQVVAIILSPLILRRLGLVWGIMCMELAAGVSLAMLATGPTAIGAAIGYAGYLAFQWMDEPAMESLLMNGVKPEERSGAAAMMWMTVFAAGAVSAPISGRAILTFGYPVVIGAAAFLLLLGGLLFGLLLRRFETAPKAPIAVDAEATASSD
jgi:MFS family permease